jgi:hypothetical protein
MKPRLCACPSVRTIIPRLVRIGGLNRDSHTPKEVPMYTYVKNVGVPAFLTHEAPAFRSGRDA